MNGGALSGLKFHLLFDTGYSSCSVFPNFLTFAECIKLTHHSVGDRLDEISTKH